jgi:precorrin-2 dehydrogenase / sirohydrochlorin ferrochelatase
MTISINFWVFADPRLLRSHDVSFDYPVFLQLTDVPVLVVGGGPIATRKAAGLVAAGARVTVVAPMIDDDLRSLADRCEVRPYRSTDIDGHRLVITATNDNGVNAAVATDATAAGVWVNSADDPQNCTFILPAIARDGTVTAALSTDGQSPALASHLRGQAQWWLNEIAAGDAARALAEQRAAMRAEGISTESVDWADRVRDALRPHHDVPTH